MQPIEKQITIFLNKATDFTKIKVIPSDFGGSDEDVSLDYCAVKYLPLILWKI